MVTRAVLLLCVINIEIYIFNNHKKSIFENIGFKIPYIIVSFVVGIMLIIIMTLHRDGNKVNDVNALDLVMTNQTLIVRFVLLY